VDAADAHVFGQLQSAFRRVPRAQAVLSAALVALEAEHKALFG
jgi:hypothetical protein